MLKSSVISTLQREFGDDSSTSVQSLLSDFIDDAYVELSLEFEFSHSIQEESFTLTGDGTLTLTLQPGSYVKRVVDTSNDELLLEITPAERETDYRYKDLTGTPKTFYLGAYDFATGQQKLILWPYPTTKVTREYLVEVLNITSENITTSDHIPLPPAYIVILKHLVRSKFYQNEENSAQASIYLRHYEKGVRLLKRRLASLRQFDVPMRRNNRNDLTGSYGYGDNESFVLTTSST